MVEDNVTKHMLQTSFSDKELRVVMGMNKILINDFVQEQVRMMDFTLNRMDFISKDDEFILNVMDFRGDTRRSQSPPR